MVKQLAYIRECEGSIPSVDVVKFLSIILYYFLSYDNVLCILPCLFDNLLYACFIFLFYEILYKIYNIIQCFTDCTGVLAVSVLLPLSESVGTQCICANVYNDQHGKLDAIFFV